MSGMDVKHKSQTKNNVNWHAGELLSAAYSSVLPL